MKKLILVVLISSISAICFGQHSAAFRKVKRMLMEKNYFAVRDYLGVNATKMDAAEKLVMEAYIGHAFNHPAASNAAIGTFWRLHSKDANDSLKLELLKLQQNNHARLFEYGEAWKVSSEILSHFKGMLSETEFADVSNSAVIWKSLMGRPKQQISVAGKTVLKMTRDQANLANIEVKCNDTSMGFIFDTGANFSTVSESIAKSFKMIMLEGRVDVGTVTGAKVSSRLAVCPMFSFGQVTVRNAVFLVLPDTALSFPQIKYQIKGIIGFPVIEGLKEVQISRNDEFIVPQFLSSGKFQNMALDFLTPVYLLGDEYFTFDTGANSTMLYSKYLKKYEKEITAEFPPADLKFGGAGGMVLKKGYKITFRPTIQERLLKMTNVDVLSEPYHEEKDHFYGNIGQDLIKQFEKMTINFEAMFIHFE